MKEWKLIRKADGYLSMIYFQINQPEFNQAFGEEIDFEWTSRDVSEDEYNQIKKQRFVEVLPMYLVEFLEAYHEAETDGKPAKMSALMQKLSDLKASIA